MRSVLLTASIVIAQPMNVETNRFSFSVEDVTGKVHLLEVPEGEQRRDEWIGLLKLAAKKFKSSDTGEASPSMISSNTLGRKRGKTFTVISRGASSAKLLE
jgi:hypothetical protein